jgi:hypothetical protein
MLMKVLTAAALVAFALSDQTAIAQEQSPVPLRIRLVGEQSFRAEDFNHNGKAGYGTCWQVQRIDFPKGMELRGRYRVFVVSSEFDVHSGSNYNLSFHPEDLGPAGFNLGVGQGQYDATSGCGQGNFKVTYFVVTGQPG